MLGVTAGALVLPRASTPGLSAYLTSKMVMVKTLEFLAVENPGVCECASGDGRYGVVSEVGGDAGDATYGLW
jgi:hypothetical protein